MGKKRYSSHKPVYDIVFFIFSNHKDNLLDPDYPETHPLGGSETAAIRMAASLRAMGHTIRIITDQNSLQGLTCDIFISLRVWQFFYDGYYPGKVNYLWCQDDVDQKLVSSLGSQEIALPVYEKLTGLFMLSTYQQVQWIRQLHVPVGKIIPTTNGIPYEKFVVNREAIKQRKPWAFYSSTPFRGLNLLLQAWPAVKDIIPDAQLHLFTSMKVYNAEEKDEYRQMYSLAQTMPGVRYRGGVGQAELRETALKCRALAYPCIFPETSCIAAMEAMAAGCAIVSTSLGALVETAWHNPLIAPGGDWLPEWTKALISVLGDDDEYERLALQNMEIARYYDWQMIARQWLKKFAEDLEK